jgi:hypothetical protein
MIIRSAVLTISVSLSFKGGGTILSLSMVVLMVLSCGFFYYVYKFGCARRYCKSISAINATSEINDISVFA